MIAITLPWMLILLIPVIGIETVIVARRTTLPTKRTLRATALANVVSTVVGVPLTWVALFACEMLVWTALAGTSKLDSPRWNSPMHRVLITIFSAPWLGPSEKDGWWAVPLAALVLLIPFFFASVWIEQKITSHFLSVGTTDVPDEVSAGVLRKAVRDANVASYGLLFVLALGSLFWGWFQR